MKDFGRRPALKWRYFEDDLLCNEGIWKRTCSSGSRTLFAHPTSGKPSPFFILHLYFPFFLSVFLPFFSSFLHLHHVLLSLALIFLSSFFPPFSICSFLYFFHLSCSLNSFPPFIFHSQFLLTFFLPFCFPYFSSFPLIAFFFPPILQGATFLCSSFLSSFVPLLPLHFCHYSFLSFTNSFRSSLRSSF